MRKENAAFGLNGGIARFDLKSERLEWLLDIETEFKENRCNDGACDSHGRLWIGTIHMDFKQGAGSLSDKIEIPIPNVTSCAFAGENLDHLVITTARGDLNEEDIIYYFEYCIIPKEPLKISSKSKNKRKNI